MDDAWNPEAEWLVKAESDLASAKVLGAAQPPLLDTGIYHCQQAGEKALKAALAWKKRPLQKTHDLEALLDQVLVDCPVAATLRDQAKLLSPYATEYRYPQDQRLPAREEFNQAVAAAEAILATIKRLIAK